MGDFINVLFKNILPIFVVAAMGFALRSRVGVDKRAVSRISFYVLSPALVFTSLVKTNLAGGEFLQIALFTVLMTLTIGIIGLIFCLLLRLPRPDTSAVVLTIMFVNGGNYGLTLNDLRYGQDGLDRAIVFYVVSTILVFTLGVFIASAGNISWQGSLKKMVTLPAFYAVLLAIIVYNLHIVVPDFLMTGIEIASTGAIPVMILVLGMQIADLKGLGRVWIAMPASLIRLLVAPFVAVGLTAWIGLQGLSRSTSIIEASMPTAVIATILATEFDVRPGLVTTTVVLSTLLSTITLPLVITVLNI